VNDDVTVTLPEPAAGQSGWDIYRTHQVTVYAELRGWRRLFARLRRRPTRYVVDTALLHEKVASVGIGEVE
jgi:hypothetical protein